MNGLPTATRSFECYTESYGKSLKILLKTHFVGYENLGQTISVVSAKFLIYWRRSNSGKAYPQESEMGYSLLQAQQVIRQAAEIATAAREVFLN